jgi:ATP synthase protein I
MLANYARIVRRSAAVTAIAAAVMLAICGVVGGSKGLIGGVIAIALVVFFFGVSIVVVGRAAKVGPQFMMMAALGSYILKILILLILVGAFQNSTAFNPRLFGLTAIVCVLVYSAAQVAWSMRLKMLYVEPNGQR